MNRYIIVGVWAVTAGTLGVFGMREAAGQDRPERSFPVSPQPGRPDEGPGMGGGPMGQPETKLVKQFDKNGDHRLDLAERTAAREFLKQNPGRRGGGPRGFGRGNGPAPEAGAKLSPAAVPSYPKAALYEPTVLRTLFLEFESKDWESELSDFHNTDVEVPATLTVDGVRYPDVGVRFRGASSYFMVGAGHKRSLNVSVDFGDSKQRLYGASTLNLLNSHEDPSFLSTVLFSHIARQHIPAPKANLVRVVINGESWGVYVNTEQFNSAFVAEHYGTTKGARWKVSGSPNGRGGLDYVGDDVDAYRARYEMKSGGDKDWEALIGLCRTLSQTPLDQLEEALKPILDIESTLWFLALDNALINNDGYWVRASDYSIYRDPKGVFHIIPHDMNETFSMAMGGPGMGGPGFGGPGGPGGPGGGGPRQRPRQQGPDGAPPGDTGGPQPGGPPRGLARDGQPGGGPGMPRGAGYELDPLIGMSDTRKPLRSRLLAVPALRAKYLEHVREIADKSLNWENLGPVVAQYRKLVEADVKADTRKLTSDEAFLAATADEPAPQSPGRGGGVLLRAFADKRRAYLLNYSEPKPSTVDAGTPEHKDSQR